MDRAEVGGGILAMAGGRKYRDGGRETRSVRARPYAALSRLADLDDVPGALDAVAGGLAGGLVPGVGVDRVAVDGDLGATTGPGDRPERAGQAHARRSPDRRGQRRPGRRA